MNHFEVGCSLDQSLTKRPKMRVVTTDLFQPKSKKLTVRGRDLNEMPQEIFSMPELEVLEMSPVRESCIDYKMSRLPPQISNLIRLRILILDTNDLCELPVQICHLVNLEQLFLSNNRLAKLPPDFSKLAKLESLHLSNNKFEILSQEICGLTALQFLDVSCNALKSVPVEISSLVHLRTLILAYNCIGQLPDSFCRLASLRTLWLGHNQLVRLPRDFGRLGGLDWGSNFGVSSTIDGNPLTDPPIQVCRKGVKAIDDYFRGNETTRKAR